MELVSDEKWQARRKVITPAFHFKMLEQFMHVFDKQGDILVNKLHEYSPDDKVDMHKLISMCALDIICGKNIDYVYHRFL